jgi:hypothetical protein
MGRVRAISFPAIIALAILLAGMATSLICTRTVLSDAEMSLVYGGCGPCEDDSYKGCPDARNDPCGDRSAEDCPGTGNTTCRQNKKSCKNSNSSPCTDTKVDCGGKYQIFGCTLSGGSCIESYSNEHDCNAWTKAWCE